MDPSKGIDTKKIIHELVLCKYWILLMTWGLGKKIFKKKCQFYFLKKKNIIKEPPIFQSDFSINLDHIDLQTFILDKTYPLHSKVE
jgi:hypothetical protein